MYTKNNKFSFSGGVLGVMVEILLFSSIFIASTYGLPVEAVPPPENQNVGDGDRVMYSYAEANVNGEGVPTVRQLTILRGKDGQARFAKNQNGTVETGTWTGPLPNAPLEVGQNFGQIDSMLDKLKLMEDPLAKLNERIGNSLQNYVLKSLALF